MQVFSDGLTFKAARITGPTHHFLGIELSEQEQSFSIIDGKTGKVISDKSLVSIVENILGSFKEEFPIHNRYYIKKVLVDEFDVPETGAYLEILKTIITEAKSKLKQDG